MSKCENYLDLISAYADGELNADEAAELKEHLAVCDECRSILETYRAISHEMLEDTEDVPEGFSEGVMAKVSEYENAGRSKKKILRITGRWIGIAACIAIILVAFPRMPGLGCGASRDTAETTTTGAALDSGTDADSYKGSAMAGASNDAMPEESMDYSSSVTTDSASLDLFADGSDDAADDTAVAEGENANSEKQDIGMYITVYGGEIPKELSESEYTVTYYENGDIEYLVPVSFAQEILPAFDNAEVEQLDTDISGMMAIIRITK